MIRRQKIFYCYPMSGLTREEIIKNNHRDITKIKELMMTYFGMCDDDYIIMDNYNALLPDKKPEPFLDNLYYLGTGIKDKMATADIVIMGHGWKQSKGCQCEKFIADTYDLQVFDLDEA